MRHLSHSIAVAVVMTLVVTPAFALDLQPAWGPRDVVPSSELAQAQSPDACANAVKVMQHDKWMSVKRGVGTELREAAKSRLVLAGEAASQGHEDLCWHQYGIAEEFNAP